ncbi:hypothetical protein GP486_006982 [Trichoglossum hirsutum]|uniref:DUF7580 domain-containing protein n=1 Tax=Trichoglossum hirsutum TaxID=265104 RepID=A0A9P8ICR4_9PEZI|nr:hypothetical protein GP486_006982 [Trichoglossum hirsutum]
MVTGVETAGIVLGSLPLLISALEHYEDIVRPTKEFFTWRKHRRKLVQELYTLRAFYDQAISLLLKPIADTEDLATMVEDPLSDLWNAGPIADKLRDMLGPAYDPLILEIGEIAEILGDIAVHLNIQGPQQGTNQLRDIVMANPPIAHTRFLQKNFQFTKRVMFTMKKGGIKTSLERLEACTKRIDTWIERAGKNQDEPAPNRSNLNFAGSLGAIQENASRIYCALFQSWCKIKPRHPTLLLLEQRLKRPQPRRRAPQNSIFNVTTESTCFKLSFNGDCYLPLQRFNTEFRIVELPSSTGRARVTVSIAQETPKGPPYNDPSNLPQVTDFCQYIHQSAHTSVGFCLDDTGGLRAYPSPSAAVQYTDRCLTLESLLPSLQARPPLEELYCLAITLVASVFQLSRTPWLGQKWSKKDIAFLRTSNNTLLDVDIKHPYLVRDFPQSSELSNRSSTDTTNDCSNLLALAILLLEISSGQSIEKVQRPEDLGNKTAGDDIADLQTANRWYKAERPRLSAGFSKAILTCLQEYLNPDANLDDPDFCNAIKEKVLQPLEDEMQFMVFGPPQ